MSDLASLSTLARSNAQLPVHVYHDEALLQREIKQLFHSGPQYVGHELMVPHVGDYATLQSEKLESLILAIFSIIVCGLKRLITKTIRSAALTMTG